MYAHAGEREMERVRENVYGNFPVKRRGKTWKLFSAGFEHFSNIPHKNC